MTARPAALVDAFHSYTINEVVKQKHAASSQLLQVFDMGYVVTPKDGGKPRAQKGKAYCDADMGRFKQYDIFNPTRVVPPTAQPGQPVVKVDPQNSQLSAVQALRLAIGMEFPIERLGFLRKLGSGPQSRDNLAKDYIRRQLGILGQMANNWRLMQVAGMIRNSLYVERGTYNTGDKLSLTSVAGAHRVSFGFADKQFGNVIGNAASEGEINLDPNNTGSNIISAAWSNSGTDIYGQLIAIDDAFQTLYGGNLSMMLMRHKTASYLLSNTGIKALAGSVNMPWQTYRRRGKGEDANGVPINGFELTLKGLPWINVLVINDKINIGTEANPVFTPVIPDDYVVFMQEPNPDHICWMEGEEPIADGPNSQPTIQKGLYVCSEWKHEPPMEYVKLYDNGIPIVMNPNVLFGAKVA